MPAPKGHPPYPGCEKGGRPPRFTTEFIEKLADELLEWLQEGKFVWFERFALNKKIKPSEMAEFARINEKFKSAYMQAKEHQQVVLFEGGLLKKFNSNMVQLILGNQYGIFEKKETVLSGDAANPLSFVLNKVDGDTKDFIIDESQSN